MKASIVDRKYGPKRSSPVDGYVRPVPRSTAIKIELAYRWIGLSHYESDIL